MTVAARGRSSNRAISPVKWRWEGKVSVMLMVYCVCPRMKSEAADTTKEMQCAMFSSSQRTYQSNRRDPSGPLRRPARLQLHRRFVAASQRPCLRQWCRNRHRARLAWRSSRHLQNCRAPMRRPPYTAPISPGSLRRHWRTDKWTQLSWLLVVATGHCWFSKWNLPKMETLERNSSYILRLRMVDPMRMRLYESRSSPHNLTSVLAAINETGASNDLPCDWGQAKIDDDIPLTVAARGVP